VQFSVICPVFTGSNRLLVAQTIINIVSSGSRSTIIAILLTGISVVVVVINRGRGGGLIGWLGIGVEAFSGSLAGIKLGIKLGVKPSILTSY
jgi:hypothetical protein